MRLHRILLLLAAALLPACGILDSDEDTDRFTLYVAPYTRTCMAMIETQCMVVREDPDDEWVNFYDYIEGFTYEPGYSYVLFVASREVPNPPADGSSREYRLLRMLEKTPAPQGS